MPLALPDALPDGYYLDNFHYLLDFVASHYAHLLSRDERNFYDRIKTLPVNAVRLYVRLTNRKGPCFRVDKIRYDEIVDIHGALATLVEGELVQNAVPALAEAVKLCSRNELMTLAAFKDWPRDTSKTALTEHILELELDNPLVELQIRVIELLRLTELRVFRLLFFGNFHQDMTEFVMHELVMPFENYPLTAEATSFRSRAAVEQVLHLKDLSEQAHELLQVDETGVDILSLAGSLPARPDDPAAARRFDRLVNQLARQLERLGFERESLTLYESTLAPPSRERRSRLLNKLGQYQEALNLCEAIARQPLNQEELEFARYFAVKVGRKSGLDHGLTAAVKASIPTETIAVRLGLKRVEQAAAQYYEEHSEGQADQCFYVENLLFNGLFGLVFWDIIFAAVPGAFYHPFQRGPADLYTGDFLVSRRSRIEDRLAEVGEAGLLKNRALNVFKQKEGIANEFVHWSFWNEEILSLALERIAPRHYQVVFSRMVKDLGSNTSGFPDLILFGDEGYRLIEVKGPGDRLQKNQHRWFQYLLEHDMPVSLVNVVWTAD